jgi:hypothetical protein
MLHHQAGVKGLVHAQVERPVLRYLHLRLQALYNLFKKLPLSFV